MGGEPSPGDCQPPSPSRLPSRVLDGGVPLSAPGAVTSAGALVGTGATGAPRCSACSRSKSCSFVIFPALSAATSSPITALLEAAPDASI